MPIQNLEEQPDGMLSDSDIELARDADRSAASSLRGAGQLSVSGVGVKPMDRSDTTSLFGPQSAEDGGSHRSCLNRIYEI